MTAPGPWEAVRLSFLNWLRERQPLDEYMMKYAEPPLMMAEAQALLERSRLAEDQFATQLTAFLAHNTGEEASSK